MGETNGKPATKEEVMAKMSRRRYGDVDLPFAGITVRVQSLNEQEWASHLAECRPTYGPDGSALVDPINNMSAERKLAGLALVDADGKRIFDDPMEAGGMNPTDLDAIVEKARELTVVSEEQSESLAKNSNTTPDAEPP